MAKTPHLLADTLGKIDADTEVDPNNQDNEMTNANYMQTQIWAERKAALARIAYVFRSKEVASADDGTPQDQNPPK